MIPTWAKVVIGLFVVAAVLGIIWLVLWLIGMGGSSPSPGPAPSSGVTKPSEYTGNMSVVKVPCTEAAKCGAAYNAADGVGWVIDNQSSIDLTSLTIMAGQNCDTTPNCVGSHLNLGSVPAKTSLLWTNASVVAPVPVGGLLLFGSSVLNKSLQCPSNIDPTTEYMLVTFVDKSGGGLSWTITAQKY